MQRIGLFDATGYGPALAVILPPCGCRRQGVEPATISPVSCRVTLPSRNRTCREPVRTPGYPGITLIYWYVTLYHEYATLQDAYRTLRDVCHTLHDVYRTLRDVHRTLRDVCRTLRDVCRTLRDVCRTLRDVYRTLRDVHRTLRDVCRTLHDAYRTSYDVCRVLPGTGGTGRCRYNALIDSFEYFSLKKGLFGIDGKVMTRTNQILQRTNIRILFYNRLLVIFLTGYLYIGDKVIISYTLL